LELSYILVVLNFTEENEAEKDENEILGLDVYKKEKEKKIG
jgi:hypothetical protein